MGIVGKYFNIIKAICDRPTENIILNGEKLNVLSLKIRNKTRLPTLVAFIQHGIGSPSQGN